MNRRAFLAAAPSALAVCQAASASAITTPIARLFEEWERKCAFANEANATESEFQQRLAAVRVLESEIQRTPVASVQDLAHKALVDTSFGNIDHSPEFWAEVCAIAGVPASRIEI